MPLLVALHVTGPFARVAVLPETLNLKRQPSLDVYWRSAPEPLLNVTETRLFCVTGALPGQVTVVVWLPAQDPSQFERSLPLPPQATASKNNPLMSFFKLSLIHIAVITLITAFILNLPEGAGNTAECGRYEGKRGLTNRTALYRLLRQVDKWRSPSSRSTSDQRR